LKSGGRGAEGREKGQGRGWGGGCGGCIGGGGGSYKETRRPRYWANEKKRGRNREKRKGGKKLGGPEGGLAEKGEGQEMPVQTG